MKSNDVNFKLLVLLGLFTSLITAVNLLGIKVTSLFGVSVSVGIFLVPLTFLITDVVGEVYGRKMARQFVGVAVISLLVILIATSVFVLLEPHQRFEEDEAYRTIFGTSLRFIAASLVAFALSQINDVRVFGWFKKKTNGKHLWMRNNGSTIISQAIDTLVFMFLAFYMVSPKFTALFILELAVPYYLFKVGFAALDTPLVYAGVRWLKK